MSRPRGERDDGARGGPPPAPSAAFVPGLMAGATLLGVVMLMLLGFMNWQETRDVRRSLDDRLDKMEARLGENSRPAPAAARRGPDPERVYSIKTDGAPMKGPAAAPVTIAEISDFQ